MSEKKTCPRCKGKKRVCSIDLMEKTTWIRCPECKGTGKVEVA